MSEPVVSREAGAADVTSAAKEAIASEPKGRGIAAR